MIIGLMNIIIAGWIAVIFMPGSQIVKSAVPVNSSGNQASSADQRSGSESQANKQPKAAVNSEIEGVYADHDSAFLIGVLQQVRPVEVHKWAQKEFFTGTIDVMAAGLGKDKPMGLDGVRHSGPVGMARIPAIAGCYRIVSALKLADGEADKLPASEAPRESADDWCIIYAWDPTVKDFNSAWVPNEEFSSQLNEFQFQRESKH